MKKNFIDESGRYTTSYLEPNLYDDGGMGTIQREYLPVYDEAPAPIEVPSYQPLPFFGEVVDNPYNPKLYTPVYEQPVYGEPISYPVYEQPVYGQPVYEQPKYEQPVMPDPDMPIYNPKFYNPIDEIMNPPALPIYDLPPAPIDTKVYIPKFPDFTQMSCAELQSEINDMNQIMMTSRMVQEVRMAYETALSDAQNAYIQNCGKNRIEPVCYDPPLAQMEGYRWIVSGQDANGCNIWEMVEDKQVCYDPVLAPPPDGWRWIVSGQDANGCNIWEMVQDKDTSGGGVVTSGGGVTGGGVVTSGGGVTGGGVVTSGGGVTGGGATTGGGVFVDDKKTQVQVVQSGSKADGTFQDDTKAVLPIKGVSKNLQPYIYAGLGIVVILLVSRMLTKKN